MLTPVNVIICLIILIVQLLLCYKVKSLLLKLIPAGLLLVALTVSLILVRTATGWDSIGYFYFVMLFATFLVPCITGWAIWLIHSYLKKNRNN